MMKFLLFVFIFSCLVYFHFRCLKMLKIFGGIKSQALSGGWQAARRVLDSFQLFDVVVEENPSVPESVYLMGRKTVSLSPRDYEGASFYSIAKVLFEVNRVFQHMRGDAVIYATTYFGPWVKIAGAFSFVLIFAAMIPSLHFLYLWGVFLFFIYVVFVLPVFFRECATLRRFFAELRERKLFPAEELKLMQNALEVMPLEDLTGLFHFWIGLKRTLWSVISENSSKP